MQLEFEVKNQTVKLLGDYELVKGSKNYLVAHFTFSEDWQDVSKKMIYFSKNSPDKEIFVGTTADGGTKIGYELDSNNSVLIPPEFIQKSGFIVNLTGVNDAQQEIITTNSVTVYVTDNGLLTDETEGKTLPEYLEEKLVAINKAVIDSEEQAEAAANSAGKAEAAKTAAQKAQQAAETAKDTAGDEAQNAANSAELAQKWAESSTSPDGEPDSKSAKTWAEEAAASASAASTSKTQAATSASNAADSASAAAGSATSASGSASTATQKAQEAANSANTASTAANTATSKASEATTAAGTATSKAEAAHGTAQDAAARAGDAADSASAAESSKTAAAQSANAAAQSATEAGNAATEAVGNPVMSVGISGKTITATKKDSTTDTFDVPAPDAATETEATTGTDNTKMMTPLRVAQATAALVASVTESNGTVTIKKADNTINEFNVVKTVNGITPTSGDVDINRKFYNSLAQLGLNYDTVTFEQIANTLPVNSTLTFYVDIVTSQPAYAPNLDIPVSGFIVVTKGINNTVPIKFTLSPIANNATTYLGEYTTYNSYGFKGWQPVVLSGNGAKPNYTGNVTVPVDTYTAWNWTDGYTVIDGFTVKFPNGYKQCVWYLYFPSGYSAMNINFPKAFSSPPCVFGSIVVANDSTHFTANVYNVTTTSCRCVTNNSGNTGTYWIAIGYDS